MMSSIELLDKMTQISLDALWKIQIQECIEISKSSKIVIYSQKETDFDRLLNQMEEGILPPNPEKLPMPPPAWLI